ncbi:MAG: tRNA epoxyqueuosine(34) reductase QueG [Niameybacter sp.]|uniref:tRNA epoxyqueuosine(34) reductase QueG n=1 Tax=Niameybacter sp. TaxID=2033640 RepID=UPI002FCBA3A4
MRQKIEVFCKSKGLDTIGFIPCRRLDELKTFYHIRQVLGLQNEFEESDHEKRINPLSYMIEGKTIIAIAFPYYDLKGQETSSNGFSIYTQRQDYHRVVKHYLNEICTYIQSLGGQAIGLVDSNALPERYIAYLAGIGFIGRNNMIITKKYGSYVFLGEIITDLEISCKDQRRFEEISEYAECGSCERCLGACPTRSINKASINPNICLSYITQKKAINEKEIKLLKGNVFGCDFCQLGCPYNEEALDSPLEPFQTLAYMQEEVRVYAEMDNAYFKEKINSTSCGWRGKNVIRRNAIIRLAREGSDIQKFKGDSPYINDYIGQLSKK